MKDRERLILTAFVNGHSELSSTTLAEQLSVTARTVLNDIHAINSALEVPIILFDPKRRRYWVKDLDRLITLLYSSEDQHGALNLATDWPFLIYFTLYEARHPLTAERLTERLHLSKTLLTQTLANLRQTIAQWHLSVVGLHDGLVLKGSMIWKKFGLAQMTLSRINRRISNAYISHIFADAYSSQSLQRMMLLLRQELLSSFSVQLDDRDEYLILVTYLLLRQEPTDEIGLRQLPPETQRFFEEFAHTRVSSLPIQLPAGSPYMQMIAKLRIAANGVQDEDMFRVLVTNLYLHRDARTYHFFPMSPLTNIPTSVAGLTELRFNQADTAVLNTLDKLLHSAQPSSSRLLVLIYDDDYLRGMLLSRRIARYIKRPIQVTSNMFQLNTLIDRYPRIAFISPKIRLLSSEMKHEIRYYNIDQFDDTGYFLKFIDEINGIS
ncbi:HTH domain-containing protein [Lacticaseibacillus hegangensis]|uniref:HTH domain-containing protein n=1 Tax=Lacticaseibacillus hegangensis TaxID=2486010 RepID=A0ABW4CYW0_9LACO|nr:HTH domain-containing protein [Lacticaseibacillus hegangensis]